jgi:hypothetical protein
VPSLSFIGDRLIIGKFCHCRGRAIHHERRQSAMSGFSTYPFIFGHTWGGVSIRPAAWSKVRGDGARQ